MARKITITIKVPTKGDLLCFFGRHNRTVEASSYRCVGMGLTKFVTGRECENCGKVRWGK